MGDLASRFAEGGWVMYPLLLLLLVGLFASLVSAVTVVARKFTVVVGGLTLGLGLLTVLVSAAGYFHALHQVDEAVVNINPEDAAVIRQAGKEGASNILSLGALAAALPLLVGGGTVGVGFSRRGTAKG